MRTSGCCGTYVGHFVCCLAVQDIVQDVDGSARLECDTSSEALVVDVLDEFLGTGLLVRGSGRFFGSGGIDGSFVVEAIEVTASILELLDPFLGLLAFVSFLLLDQCWKVDWEWTDLGDHHVAVESAFAKGLGGPVDVRTDHCDDGSAKGHVGDEVAVHNVDVKPVCAMADGV